MATDTKDFQVPFEAVVFFAAVGGFVVLLFVFFLYLNKSLCFTKCSGLPCDKTEPVVIQSKSKKLSGTFEYDDPEETSSDSDDEVLRRYQQTMMAPRPSSLYNLNREVVGNRRQSTNEAAKTNTKPTGIATYLRRDEKVRSYNSEGCTEVSSCRPTTKFIIGEPDEIETDPETRAESEGQGQYADEVGSSPAVENGSLPLTTVSSDERNPMLSFSGGETTTGADGGPTTVAGSVEAYENKAFRHQQKGGDDEQDIEVVRVLIDDGPSTTGGQRKGASLAECDTASNLDQEDNLFDVGDLDDREPILISKCGNLNITFHYQTATGRMTVTVHEARDIPSKDRGGAHNTQVRLLLLPTKKTRQKTKIKPGDCPKYEETFHFKVPIEELNNMGLRIRLYGCERMRRERMIGEHVKGFATIPLDNPFTQWLALEPRSNLSHGDSKTDIASLSRSDSGSSGQSMQHGGMPELLIGLAYNGMTGRLSVQVIKGSNFKNMAMARAPDTYVKLTMMSPNGQEITRSKTSIRRGQPHPLYKETFMFQVPLFQLPDVTLMVSVFYNRSIKRKEMIGWFSLGYSNSSEEELSHWTDMRESKGEEVCRWHVLLEP